MARRRTPAGGADRIVISGADVRRYSDLDPELAEGLLTAVSREYERRPTILGTKPAKPGRSKVTGVSAQTKRVLADAGYRENEQLAEFRLADLGIEGRELTLVDLEDIHRQTVRAHYTYLHGNVPGKLIEWLSDQRVLPWESAGFFERCRGELEPHPGQPSGIDFGKFKDPDKYRPTFPDKWQKLPIGPTAPKPPRPGPPPDPRNWATTVNPAKGDRDDLIASVDLVDEITLGELDVDPARALDLLGQPPAKQTLGETLMLAQGFAAQGEVELAGKLAAHVGSLRMRGLSPLQQYQVKALAPTIATVSYSMAQPEQALLAAQAAIVSTVPGTRASEIALKLASAAAKDEADRALAGAFGMTGPGAIVGVDVAAQAFLDVLTGGKLGNAQKNAALTLHSGAVLLDLYRALGVALVAVDGPVKWSNPSDAMFDGRALPRDATSWIVGSGGVSSLVDPLHKAMVLGSWHELSSIHLKKLGIAPTLPGDLFRFDWLLGEIRTLADDLARIEELLAALTQLLLQAALGKLDAITGIVGELARIKEHLLPKLKAISDAVPGLLSQIVDAVSSSVLLIGVIEFLKVWPHARWVAIFRAVAAAVAAGTDPVAAFLGAIRGPVLADIASRVNTIVAQINTTLAEAQTLINQAAFPPALVDDLKKALQAAGLSTAGIDEIVKPVQDAVAALNLQTLAAPAIARLNALATTTTLPGWLEALLVAYVIVPLLVAIGIALVTGPAAVVAIEFVLALGTQYLITLVLRALGDALGLVENLRGQVERALGQLQQLTAALLGLIADIGALQAHIANVLKILGRIGELIPADAAADVQKALNEARTILLKNVRLLGNTIERSFFRETLELVDMPTTFPQKPIAGPTGLLDPLLGSSAQVSAALSTFEAARVDRARGQEQLLTQVLSLRQILDVVGSNAKVLDPLLQGSVLSFWITPEFLDRVAPGLHRMRIKDVQVQIDFNVSTVTQTVLQQLLAAGAVLAGGEADPALDGRIPGAGFPGLPVSAGRIPTGIPALLSHPGLSAVRLKPSRELAREYDQCGEPIRAASVRDPLRGTRLLPDPDPDADAAGWRILEFYDAPQYLLFSHFDVLEDGVRFIHPEKRLKPFEHRGMLGQWSLEVPALALGSVKHQLPPAGGALGANEPLIRDVRLIVSAVAEYDRDLATLVKQPPLATVKEPALPAVGLGLVPLTIEQLLASLDATIKKVNADLLKLVNALSQGVGSFLSLSQGVASQVLLQLAGATTTPLANGNVARAVLLTTDTLTNKAAVLAGSATGTWPLSAYPTGIDPSKVVRVVQVVVAPVTDAPLIGGAITFPTASGSLGFTPTTSGASTQTEPVKFTGGTAAVVPGADLAQPGAATVPSALGTWTLQPPLNMPTQLTEMLVGIILEVQP